MLMIVEWNSNLTNLKWIVVVVFWTGVVELIAIVRLVTVKFYE